MHCYEYEAMHMLLKSELKRLFPDRYWKRHDVEEAFCRMDVDTLKEIENLQPRHYILKLGLLLKQPIGHNMKAAEAA